MRKQGATFLAPNISQFDEDTGCPSGSTPWARTDPRHSVPVGYYRDPSGIVFVNGSVTECGSQSASGTIFQLPDGYRPSASSHFPVFDGGDEIIHVAIGGTGNVTYSGLPNNRNTIVLDGITFRCAPSGQNGCP